MSKPRGILVLPQTYPPDVGGVETHLADLTEAFQRHPEWTVWIAAFKPIVTDVPSYRRTERQGNVSIRRFWWIGGNLFRKLEPYPPLMALYIIPYFAFRLFFFMLPRLRKIDVIHVHGINMAMIGLCFARLFRKRIVFQSHALYSFQAGSLFTRVVARLLRRMDAVATLCHASRDEIVALGVPSDRVSVYRYWIDLQRFCPPTPPAERTLATILFVGRLIGIKGEGIVVELARRFPRLRFKVIGTGPNQPVVEAAAKECPNLTFVGMVPNSQLQEHYRAADLLLVPSQYPEGFGRVIAEALACWTPVVASNVGGIPDAMDATVGILCDTSADAFAQALQRLLDSPGHYARLRANARPYAERQFSDANAGAIFAMLMD